MRQRPLAFGLSAVLWLCVPSAAYPAPAPPIGAAWWVVLQVFPADPDRKLSDPNRIQSAARRCGNFTVFNELSSKFRDFPPGKDVYFVGAFSSSRVAERTKESLTKCFPDAFVKYGDYAGE